MRFCLSSNSLTMSLLRLVNTRQPYTLRAASRRLASSQSQPANSANVEIQPKTGNSPNQANKELGKVRGEDEVVAAGPVSGQPDELAIRPVRIFMPSPPTAQSAKATSHHWRLDWDILQGAGRWENNLMGWASTADYMQATSLKFKTKDAAIHFCEKQGWPFFVQEPKIAKFVPKSYANNYLHSPGPLRNVHTK